MRQLVLGACLLVVSAAPLAAQDPVPPVQQPAPVASEAAKPTESMPARRSESAPMRVNRGARLYVDPADEFGMAFSAAILKKKVPVVCVNDKDKADFFVQSTTKATKEGTGERVAKVLVFGAWAGSGRHFEGTVAVVNRDGATVFAHNSKKENFQSAAENMAKNLKKHIEGN